MRVAGITNSGDWVFGKSKASYKTNSQAILQNVVTRLRSFKDDWFLDVDAGGDWINLIGNRATEEEISREVERIILETDGVKSILEINVSLNNSTRDFTINFTYTDIFNLPQTFDVEVLNTEQ